MQWPTGEGDHTHSASYPRLLHHRAEGGHCRFKLTLNLDPRRYGALPLHDPVHEELFTNNERVVLFVTPFKGLPAALDGMEVSFLSCPLGGEGKGVGFKSDAKMQRTSMRSSMSPAHPFMLTGFGRACTPPFTFLVMPRR